MAQCLITGKKKVRGKTYSIRGISKKKKGIGLNITGKTKRWFKPNVQNKRFWFAEENRFILIPVSTAAMRTIDRYGVAKVVNEMRSKGINI